MVLVVKNPLTHVGDIRDLGLLQYCKVISLQLIKINEKKRKRKKEKKKRDLGLTPGLGRSRRGGHGNPLHYSCLENTQGQRNLAGYSPQGRTESDMTEHMHSLREHKFTGFLEPGPSRALGLPAGKLCCLRGHPDNSTTQAGS